MMEELAKEILNLLYKPGYIGKKYTFNEIRNNVNLGKGHKADLLRLVLNKLEEEGKIYQDVRGRYRSFPNECGYIQGEITINKRKEGLLEQDNVKAKVLSTDLDGVLDGDIVLLKKLRKRENGYQICKVAKVIKRKDGLLVAEVHSENGKVVLKPFSATLDGPLVINGLAMKALVEGERVVVKIDKKEKGQYFAGFIKSIGHRDDPDAEIKMIAVQHGIVVDFSPEAMAEANALPTEVLPKDKIGRLDLRDKTIFSIDGISTKDRDDAISIEMNDRGNYILGVHIADVSHYVHPPMKLWDEALERGTSAYLVNTVIPMLPHKLSNGICSLNPLVDRLAFSCIMEISPKGEILSYDFVDTLINSKKAMTYEDVNSYLEDGQIVPGYEEFIEDLDLFQKLSTILEKVKIRRGYVNFGCNDLKITLSEDGVPEKIEQREEHKAQKIIENCMLVAGECAANYMIIPSPYRVHPKPDEDKVEKAYSLIQKSGIRVKSCHELVNGKVIQTILSQIADLEDRDIVSNILLRAMNRASYSVNNDGHFGLGLDSYTQFTSPIRRAPDLVTHYNLRMQRDNKFNINDADVYFNKMNAFCRHASKKETDAEQAERDANFYEMTRYIEQHLGEKFSAHVTYVSSRAIYIKTIEGIEGKLDVSDIDGDNFYYDERTNSFKGKDTKIKIKLGTRLILTALDTKREYKTINFGIDTEEVLTLKKVKKS